MAKDHSPLRDFLSRESSSGFLLAFAALIGIFLANTPAASSYFSFLEKGFSIDWGLIVLSMTVQKFINYVLMTIFFFVVGLEIKRELVSGHLSTLRRAITPFFAALGGMLAPALIYLAIAGDEAPRGWAVPVATDIALAVGLISAVGSRASMGLKTFLLAIAVIDDIGAILIIAFVYSAGLSIPWLGAALAAIVLSLAMRWRGIESLLMFIFVGIGLWYCLYRSGVHPTLAGVVMGLLTPAKIRNRIDRTDTTTWIEWLEKKVHPWSSFVIIPLFALANSGVSLSSDDLREAFQSPIAWGIIVGLIIGKPLGIMALSYLGSRTRIAELPEGSRFIPLLGTSSAAGIGFTVAIFLANLAFEDTNNQAIAVTAVVAASVVSAFMSLALFSTQKRNSR